MLAVDQVAPEFELPDQDGNRIALSGLRGKWVLLWWYPKASTSGCTLEGQGLRDRSSEIEELGGVILGASFDTVEDNKVFAEQQSFPYRLLSDHDKKVGTRYEVLRQPDDKFAELANRISYLIDPQGVIRIAYEVSDPAGHAEKVIEDLRKLVS